MMFMRERERISSSKLRILSIAAKILDVNATWNSRREILFEAKMCDR